MMILPKPINKLLATILEKLGYVLVRKSGLSRALDRRNRLLASANIDLVIDVGANQGQYGKRLRSLGYSGRIVSFEPMREAYACLKATADQDGNWEAAPLALGEATNELTLNISKNSISSSILDMRALHETYSPNSYYVAKEVITMTTLDTVFDDIANKAKHIWLKIDVQGFEDRVLRGAQASLEKVEIIQIEW